MRSLADEDPMARAKKMRISPLRAGVVVLLLAWLVLTLGLGSYWWENGGWKERLSSGGTEGGLRLLDGNELGALGFGVGRMSANASSIGLGELMQLRAVSRAGSAGDKAVLLARLRAESAGSEDETYRMTWAPVLACADAGCDNAVYVQAAGELAARAPQFAGNAMVVEAAYWHAARTNGDSVGEAAAMARLQSLTDRYGSEQAKAGFGALNACGRSCPVFDELLLDFVAQAAKN
ncbi:MAG: hypothetical protein M1530_04235 [Candidatus Marsarchaeota archaeon]|nr:hypothetical protein [Candidatus Marsarchaeota archaeon]